MPGFRERLQRLRAEEEDAPAAATATPETSARPTFRERLAEVRGEVAPVAPEPAPVPVNGYQEPIPSYHRRSVENARDPVGEEAARFYGKGSPVEVSNEDIAALQEDFRVILEASKISDEDQAKRPLLTRDGVQQIIPFPGREQIERFARGGEMSSEDRRQVRIGREWAKAMLRERGAQARERDELRAAAVERKREKEAGGVFQKSARLVGRFANEAVRGVTMGYLDIQDLVAKGAGSFTNLTEQEARRAFTAAGSDSEALALGVAGAGGELVGALSGAGAIARGMGSAAARLGVGAEKALRITQPIAMAVYNGLHADAGGRRGEAALIGGASGLIAPAAADKIRTFLQGASPLTREILAETISDGLFEVGITLAQGQQITLERMAASTLLAGVMGLKQAGAEVSEARMRARDVVGRGEGIARNPEDLARPLSAPIEAPAIPATATRRRPEAERPVEPEVPPLKTDPIPVEVGPTKPRAVVESPTPEAVPAAKVETTRVEAEAAPAAVVRDPEVTSIKNRVTNAERAARGVDPMEEPLRQAWGDVYDKAKSVVRDNPSRADELVRELSTNPRPHTTEEAAILSLKRVDLHRARTKADEDGIKAAARGDLDAVAEAKARSVAASNEFLALEIATKKGGTETARALAVRRAELNMDYSLSAMEATRRAENDYKPLTPRQAAETKKLHDQLAKAIADRDAYHSRVIELESARSTGGRGGPGSKSTYGSTNRVVTQDSYAKARESLRLKLTQLNVGIDPTVLKDLVTIGAYHVEAGARGFAKWSKAILADFSEDERKKVAPHLSDIYKESLSKAPPIQGQDGAVDVRQAGKIAEIVMEGGVRGRDAVIDEVHSILKETNPDITRRQTMDAISGYGRVKKLDRSEIKVELRELKGQMLQIAKLEDMAGGKAPLKTGLERQAPGPEQSDLIREVNEAKRKGGYVSERKGRELRSVLQTTQRRLETQIASLEKQIEARARKVRDKTPAPTSERIEALKARRDELSAKLDEVAPRPGMSDEGRISARKKQLRASIESLDRQIRSGEKDVVRRSPLPVDDEIAALTARRDELRARYDEVFAKPGLTDEQRLAVHKKVLARRIKEYERRLGAGEMAVPARRPLEQDAEAIRLEAALESAKTEWMAAVVRDRMANRTVAQKALSAAFVEAPNLARAAMTSIDVSAVLRQGGFLALGHPVRAFKALGPMFRSLTSRGAMERSEAQLRLRKNFGLARRSGLYLAEEGNASLSKMEEAYMSRWIERRPMVEGQPARNAVRGVANAATAPIRASQRAYNTFLNRLRMDSFDAMLAGLQNGAKPTPAEAKAVANYINTVTGRGLSDSSKLASLNTVFFSPRLVASRFEIATGALLARNKGRVRKMIAAEYARFLGGIGTIYGLAALAGADVEDDPHSSDFGKIRFDDTRLDPLTGLAQVTTLMARLTTGQTKSLQDESVRDIRGDVGFGRQDAADIIKQFLRSKLAPVAGAMVDVASGTTVVGEEVTPASVAANLTVPMSVREIAEAMQAQGVPRGAAMGILSMFGMGISTFGKRKKKPARSIR